MSCRAYLAICSSRQYSYSTCSIPRRKSKETSSSTEGFPGICKCNPHIRSNFPTFPMASMNSAIFLFSNPQRQPQWYQHPTRSRLNCSESFTPSILYLLVIEQALFTMHRQSVFKRFKDNATWVAKVPLRVSIANPQ
jgi:hypothetical protein